MIPSKNQSNPQYSFGREVRIKGLSSHPKTDYLYNNTSSQVYKYDRVSRIIF